MNTPNASPQKSSLHPLIIAAAIAVLVVSAVGTAAIMGWLPSSMGGNHANSELSASDQLASAPMTAPSTGSYAHNAPAYPAARAQHPVQHHVAPQAAAHHECGNCGVVEAVNESTTRGEGSGVGAAGGAVVGGLLGNQVGGGRGRELATIAGAIGGAVAGNQVEGNVRASHSYAVTVRLNDGSSRTFHQSTAPNWRSGDRVRIVDGALRGND
ncbi:MAG TPA: hypothetical protein DCW29_10070 [Janthinobacterium sp.]|nr:hypothetical protein [Janthinobacterium sp.]